tara:strand:- start:8021 stop:8557 length:537 start_codon:yes stop_codon:yes gene_type:complete
MQGTHMFTRQVQFATLCAVQWITLLSAPILYAGELSELTQTSTNKAVSLTNDNAKNLPLQSASDSQGNTISLPSDTRSALEYRADEIYLKPSLQKLIKANQQTNTSSRQAGINVVDDPSCRWLNNRIKHLTKQQRQNQNSQFSHYQDEIDIRKSEWTCLKCATTGPNDVDRGECQHKR